MDLQFDSHGGRCSADDSKGHVDDDDDDDKREDREKSDLLVCVDVISP